ncbi:MAG: hypothetical protein HOQ27_10685 [Dermatophilaceae bacterium]|nr:hypothetical protein [Dermatophilaceae bacterium]
MPLRLSDSVRNAKVDAAVGKLNAGVGTTGGTIKIYSGAQPATPATAATGTLLATVLLANPAFGAAAGGSASLTDPASVNAAATGTAGWARFTDRDGNAVFDGDVTATGGGGIVTLSSTALTSGAPVDITGGTYSQPM